MAGHSHTGHIPPNDAGGGPQRTNQNGVDRGPQSQTSDTNEGGDEEGDEEGEEEGEEDEEPDTSFSMAAVVSSFMLGMAASALLFVAMNNYKRRRHFESSAALTVNNPANTGAGTGGSVDEAAAVSAPANAADVFGKTAATL
jgi:hypothetical protein